MRIQRLVLLIFISLAFLASRDGEKQGSYTVVLNIKEISLNGKSFPFNPVRTLTLIPNSDTITMIPLEADRNVGVTYFLSEQLGVDGSKLMHNAVFYELVNDGWKPLTEVDHLEPAKTNPNTNWRITTSVDGIQKFAVEFDYTITPR